MINLTTPFKWKMKGIKVKLAEKKDLLTHTLFQGLWSLPVGPDPVQTLGAFVNTNIYTPLFSHVNLNSLLQHRHLMPL